MRRAVWAERVAQWRESGQSAEEFAAAIGVHVNSLRNWRWKLQRERKAQPACATTASTAGTLGFVEVVGVAAPPPERFEVVLPCGATLRVPQSFDVDALRRLVAVLERR